MSAWELLLPEGVLDYFEVGSAKKVGDSYEISLIEKPLTAEEFNGKRLMSKGFFAEVSVRDFPIRGKASYLKIKRRRWLDEDTEKVFTRDWELLAKGTRMTKGFASFLKGLH